MSERCACGAPLAEYGPCWIDGKPPAPLADGGKTVFDGYPLSRAEYVERIHEGGRGGYGIATHDVLMHHDAALRAEVERYDQKDRQKTREINILVPENRQLRARVAELERVIEEAPHGRGCGGTKHWTGQPICDCWKSKAKVSG